MRIEREGNITFAFPASWLVLKYDDSQFYRGPVVRLGADRAAVDFVAAVPTDSLLLLLEVKDFRKHGVENRGRMASGALAAEVVSKVWDTLGALYTGCRAGSYAGLRPFAAIVSNPLVIQAVLLLEEDPLPQSSPGGHLSAAKKFVRDNAQKQRGDLLNLLQNRLKPFRIDAFLYNSQTVPARAGWTATAQPSTA